MAKRQLSSGGHYLQAARVNRPEVNMVRAGLIAREAQVDLARSQLFSRYRAGLSATWARAPRGGRSAEPVRARRRATSCATGPPWCSAGSDPSQRGAGRASEGADGRAPRDRALRLGWHRGRGRDRVRAGARRAGAREQAYGAAQKTARQWIIAIQQGIDVGTKEDADIVDAARQWATQKFNHLTAMMDLNLAWSNLALATAWDDIAPNP